ncbi:hypothetical protein BLOT_000612 [Blomia tropicalis]|nr:hypothetical protein BLOT_000612 [Blomia tropicalis]
MKDGEQSLAHKAKLANHTLLNDDNDQTTPESIGLYYLNNIFEDRYNDGRNDLKNIRIGPNRQAIQPGTQTIGTQWVVHIPTYDTHSGSHPPGRFGFSVILMCSHVLCIACNLTPQ